MDINKLCFNCMKDSIEEGGICTSCGFSNAYYQVPPDQLVPLTSLNGRYLVGRALGVGSFGITYIALDSELQEVAAIKELYAKDKRCFEENKKLFLDEARILARFNKEDNEGIVTVKEHFEENGTAYIVMEYLAGETLKQKVEKEKMTYRAIKDLMAPVCHALMKVHQFGVIHMDVSPDNIMVLEGGGAKLLDFGGMKSVNTPEQHNYVSFKSGYAPPEQCMENGKTGQWTDVYAAAATMYYCLTGVKPVDAMERKAGADILKPSQMGAKIPVRAERALMKALELEPGQRYQSIEDFWNAFHVKGKRNVLAISIVGGVAVIGLGIALLLNSGILAAGDKNPGAAANLAKDQNDEAEGTVAVYKEGDLVENKAGINTIASVLDGTTMLSISRDENLYEPTMIVWEQVWDETQQFEFVLMEESRYRIYPVNQPKGKRQCLEYNETDDKILLRDESDKTSQLFRIVYAGADVYLIQSYNESILGFDVNKDGSTDGNAIFARPYDALEDSRLGKWLIQSVE